MRNDILKNGEIKMLAGYALVIAIAKSFLYLLIPSTQQDPVMTISSVFSYLNGLHHSSLFAHAYLGDYVKAPVLAWLAYPYFSMVPANAYSLYFFHLIFILINVFLVFVATNRKNLVNPWFYFIVVAYISSSYTYAMRIENVVITFILISIVVWSSTLNDWIKIFLLGLCSALAGLLHPIGGIVIGLFVLIYILLERRFVFFLMYGVVGGTMAFLISKGTLFEYFQLFLGHDEMAGHLFNPATIVQYCTLSLPVVFLFSIAILNYKDKLKLGLIVLGFFLLIMCFGRSYYYVYSIGLLVVLVVTFNFQPIQRWQKMILAVAMLFAFFFTVGLPLIQLVENPLYAKSMRLLQKETRGLATQLPDSVKIWVPGSVGMAIIEKPNSRFHMKIYIYQPTIQEQLDFAQHDVVVIDNYKDKKYIWQLLEPRGLTVDFQKDIEPVPGLITMSSLFKTRSDSLGLWHGVIKKL